MGTGTKMKSNDAGDIEHRKLYLIKHHRRLADQALFDPILQNGLQSFISWPWTITEVFEELLMIYSRELKACREELIAAKRAGVLHPERCFLCHMAVDISAPRCMSKPICGRCLGTGKMEDVEDAVRRKIHHFAKIRAPL